MAASYSLIGSQQGIQVTSPTTRRETQVCTIQTVPSGVIASLWVDRATFDTGAAGPDLAAFADNIEAIIAQGKAIGGTGTTTLDDNGLQQTFVTFTVGYTPKGAQPGDITTEVDVPTSLIGGDLFPLSTSGLQQAQAMIDAAYSNLVAAAGGTPDLPAPGGPIAPPAEQSVT